MMISIGSSLEEDRAFWVKDVANAWHTSNAAVLRLAVDWLFHSYCYHIENNGDVSPAMVLKEMKKEILEVRQNEKYKYANKVKDGEERCDPI